MTKYEAMELIDKGSVLINEDTYISALSARLVVEDIYDDIDKQVCSNCKHFDSYRSICLGSLNRRTHNEWYCADWEKQDDTI